MPQQPHETLLDIIRHCDMSVGEVAFIRYLACEAVTALVEISADLATEPSVMSRRAGNTAAAALADFARRAPALDVRTSIESRGPTNGH